MRIMPTITMLVALSIVTPALSEDDVCAEFRAVEAEYFKRPADGDFFSDDRMKVIEAYVNASRRVHYSSEQYGFGVRTSVEVVEHLKRTADLTRWALLRWLGESPLPAARQFTSLAGQIADDARRLDSQLADLLCQIYETDD